MSLILIIHIDNLTVYTSPDLLEYSPHVLDFITRGERQISGFQHFFKGCITFQRGDLVCVSLLRFVALPHFYNKIAFVSFIFYHNHQIYDRIAYLRSEEHIHGSTE